MFVGESLFYKIEHDLEPDEGSITLDMVTRIERFASFNETWTAFTVNGNNVTLKDVGRWDIQVKVRYETAPFQTFEGLFRLYILMPGEDPVFDEEEPDWVEAQERAAI